MTRADFLQLLARAVRDNQVTESEAVELLKRFDAREMDERETPLPETEAIKPADEGDITRALVLLSTLGALSALHRRLKQTRERLQDDFQARGATLARRYTETGDLRSWQRGFRWAVVDNIIQQHAVASNRIPTVAKVAKPTLIQSAYVSRWAEQIALKSLADEPPSYFQMAARAALYAGAGRAESFRAEEEGLGAGYVVDYESQDDGRTCDPCAAAEADGPYLPGEGPMPGEVCDGQGYCRCRRVTRSAV